MVDHIIRSMDINPLMDTYDGIGALPYSPKMLLSLVVFAYINGVYSCRGIADALKYVTIYVSIHPLNRLYLKAIVTTQHPIENFSLIKHKLDFAYFHHHYKLFND